MIIHEFFIIGKKFKKNFLMVDSTFILSVQPPKFSEYGTILEYLKAD